MAYQTPWLKKVLIPFWILQTLAALAYLGFEAWILGENKSYFENEDDYDYSSYSSSYSSEEDAYSRVFYAIGGILIGLAALTAVFNIIEMILYGVKKLSPVTVVVFNCINTPIWAGLLVLLILSTTILRGSAPSWVCIVVLFLTSLGKLIYSSIMLHRHRRGRVAHRGEYTPAAREADTSHHPTSYGGPTPEISQSTQPGGAAHGYYSPASVGARG